MTIKRDFRTLAPATQAELRRVAVAMVRAGKTRVEAAETVGVNRRFVGQWVTVAAQGGEAVLAGRRRGSSPGRAESAERGAGGQATRLDRTGVSRSVRSVFYAVDAPGGAGADRTRDRGLADPAGGRPLSAGLGFYCPAASAASHRAAGGGGPGLAGEYLPGDCPQSQGARLRNPVGRRDRPVQSGQLRP